MADGDESGIQTPQAISNASSPLSSHTGHTLRILWRPGFVNNERRIVTQCPSNTAEYWRRISPR